jgi:hypothetical protein
MSGIDADVVREQIKVVRKQQRLAQDDVREAQEQEWAALAVEQRAHDEATEAQRIQQARRAEVDECAETIGELQDLLELLIPAQRPAAAGS